MDYLFESNLMIFYLNKFKEIFQKKKEWIKILCK